MKKFFIALLCTIFALNVFGQDSYPVFVDSLTGVSYIFPKGTKLLPPTDLKSDFAKQIAVTPESYLFLLSKANKKKKPFTWEEINEYDSGNKFGKMLSYEKVGNDLQGWIRYYEYTNNKKQKCISCVTLIRYNRYAIYMVEEGANPDKFITKQVISSMQFPKSTYIKETSTIDRIIIWGIILLGFVEWLLRKFIKGNSLRLTLLILSTIALILYIILYTDLGWVGVVFMGIFNVVSWSMIYYCKNFNDIRQLWSNLD